MSSPVLTTVVALEAQVTGNTRPAFAADFNRLVALEARQLGAVVEERYDDRHLCLVMVLPPDVTVSFALRRVAKALNEFEMQQPGSCVRGLAHHGIVFASTEGTTSKYVGSAIRAAQMVLQRTHVPSGMYASRDFASFAAAHPDQLMHLAPVQDSELHVVGFTEQINAVAAGTPVLGLSARNADFLVYIKRRLAEEIGPFASALIDNACRATTTATELAIEMGQEIEKEAARLKFESDVLAWIEAYRKK